MFWCFVFGLFFIEYAFPTETLDPTTLLNKVYEYEDILENVSSECDKRRDYLSTKHGIPRDRIDSLVPYDLKKNIDGCKFSFTWS